MRTHIYAHIFDADFIPLPVYFTSSSSWHRQENVNRPTGLRPSAQILFVLDGEGILYYDGKQFSLRKGCAFYVDCAVPHAYENTGGLITAWITWLGSGQEELRNYIGKKSFLYSDRVDVKAYALEIGQIEREYFTQKREGVLSAMLYALLLRFFDEQREPKPSEMDLVLRYMEQHFGEKLTLMELAELCHMSRSVFCKKFRDTYGCTAFEKLIEIRLLNARTQIQSNSGEAIGVIARQCGFEDVSYFCKAYKRLFSVTPGAERMP
ncbi:MAG: AraC family transcriptional regulator [Clostridia bacterium]|nr:AraC family transcriptional regulator [Clostridia bacterium]